MPFFAYAKGLNGPEPVKYRERQTNGHGMSADNITQIEISEADFAQPLRVLARMFPAPATMAALFLLLSFTPVQARDSSKWAQASPERRQFFNNAKMPDSPRVSCCGLADAYEADDFETDPDGSLVAIITCNEPDVPGTDKCAIQASRDYENEEGERVDVPARPPGTRIKIPNEKILKPHTPDNKTGHGWVFINPDGGNVWCYAFPGGF